MYKNATLLLQEIKNKHGVSVPFSLIKKEIIINIGGNLNKTVRPYIKMMIDLEMIRAEEGSSNVTILI